MASERNSDARRGQTDAMLHLARQKGISQLVDYPGLMSSRMSNAFHNS